MTNDIKKLFEWAEKQNWTANWLSRADSWKGDHCDPNTRQIWLKRSRPHIAVYSLLHELGHAQQFSLNLHETDFKVGLRAYWRRRMNNDEWYSILKFEIDAWDRGKQIAQQCGINLDIPQYDRYAARNIKTYC